jgi:hypothetical protein
MPEQKQQTQLQSHHQHAEGERRAHTATDTNPLPFDGLLLSMRQLQQMPARHCEPVR